MNRASAFSPCSVGNVAVGFDLMGFSMEVAGDTVHVEKATERKVVIEGITGLVTNLPVDSARNTATAGLERLIRDKDLDFGFRVRIEKGIPLGSGMGGSGASAVAAIVAANALLPQPMQREQLLPYALVGESISSGSLHADNIAPSLLGGLTLAQVDHAVAGELPSVRVTRIPIPREIQCVLVHPHVQVETKTARGILSREVKLSDYVQQSAYLAAFIAGCFQNDLERIGASMHDVIIEPQRAHLIPGFYAVQKAALEQGALGCTISGAGPSMFAWARSEDQAKQIMNAMTAAFAAAGVQTDAWIAQPSTTGARVLP